MLTKGNQIILLPVVNSDAHKKLPIPTSTGGKLRCSQMAINSYLYLL